MASLQQDNLKVEILSQFPKVFSDSWSIAFVTELFFLVRSVNGCATHVVCYFVSSRPLVVWTVQNHLTGG